MMNWTMSWFLLSYCRQSAVKRGKLFFVATSVLSSTTQCYVTDATLTACAAKRKRNLIVEADNTDGVNTDFISPMAPDRLEGIDLLERTNLITNIFVCRVGGNLMEYKTEHLLYLLKCFPNICIIRREDELEPGLEDAEEGSLRDGRFVLYWATSTSTSYTSTSTLASLECTPSGFSLSLCG